MEQYIVEVDNLTIRFNMASEKVDNLKEYVIKLAKKELKFKEFLCIVKSKTWGILGVNRSERIRKIHFIESNQRHTETLQRDCLCLRNDCTFN